MPAKKTDCAHTSTSVAGWLAAWQEGWKDGRTDGRMDEWVNGAEEEKYYCELLGVAVAQPLVTSIVRVRD